MKIILHENPRVHSHPYISDNYEIKMTFYNINKSAIENSGFDMRYSDWDNVSLSEIKNNMKYYQYLQLLDSNYTNIMSYLTIANIVLEELYFNRCSRSKYGSNLFSGIQEDDYF
jgi:hypothetical protein